MYSYIKGQITEVKPTHIVIENNNIGFLIYTPNNLSYIKDSFITIYTYQYVREDIINLYGFENSEARDMFIKLLGVSGIGPKSALSLLSGSDINALNSAIYLGDIKYLSSFPGIGVKAANQIVLDLKGKMNNVKQYDTNVDDAIQALLSLGFSNDKVKAIIKKIENIDSLDSNTIVKKALILLSK